MPNADNNVIGFGTTKQYYGLTDKDVYWMIGTEGRCEKKMFFVDTTMPDATKLPKSGVRDLWPIPATLRSWSHTLDPRR